MIVAPASTPRTIVQRLNAELRDIVGDPAVAADWAKRGLLAQVSAPPPELDAFIKSEIVRWGEVVRQAGAAGIE